MKNKADKTRANRLRRRFVTRTKGITVEHRASWGDELRCNDARHLLAEATATSRSWLVIISLYWEAPSGAYEDAYKFEFQSCTLCDAKSIEKFDALRDHILSTEKAKGNLNQFKDWGWFATPWESRHKYVEPGEEILVASFNKDA